MAFETLITVSWYMILPLSLVGSLLHFTFDWTEHNRIAAIFSAVNESYWEHIKIAIWPMVLLQMILFVVGGYQYPAFLPAATIALYSIPISMIGIIFLYKSVTKRNLLWIDIATFFLSIAIAQTLFILVLEQLDPSVVTVGLAVLFLIGLLVAFLRFTLRPPSEPDVFVDPITEKYGLLGHPDHENSDKPQDDSN